MNFRKANNITGWIVFLICLATYALTREARGSLWDCGEFVSCVYKQQITHPPGSPFFVLLGKLFIVLFGNSPMKAANAVNLMSATASAATGLFLFWSVTHLARKMLTGTSEQMSGQQIFTAMSAGVVGALANNFSDSFWFSGVEGEVYALSSFFTALAFWAMLKWETADEKAGNDETAKARADRWIVFLFFMLGLAICVHLLGLLTIPAIVMIYYFRRYRNQKFNNTAFIIAYILSLFATLFIPAILLYNYFKKNKDIFTGTVFAFFIGCAITGIVQLAVIQYTIKSSQLFDVFFVNNFHLPFLSGFFIYYIVLAAVIAYGLFFSEKKFSKGKIISWFIIFLLLFTLPFFTTKGGLGGQVFKFILIAGIGILAGYYFKPRALKMLKLSLWSLAFMILGYLLYTTCLIRSNANPAIDMNNVETPGNLYYYLSREQYGSAPLLYGPHFSADYKYGDNGYVEFDEGDMQYVKGKDRYIPIGRDKTPKYESSDMQLFPRIWDRTNDQFHADFYARWLNLGTEKSPITGRDRYSPPTLADNVNWFFSYQMGLMYWRYFMWNFSGKQNDIQGYGNKRDGNWISGISVIDNARLGDQTRLPDSIKHNKEHNNLWMLPFLLGIIGCVYQFLKNKKDWLVTFLLFFFTGIAIVLYLNQPGNQPRERDYAYAGSFYAFTIWIGLAVVAFVKIVQDADFKKILQTSLIFGGVLTFLITAMSSAPGTTGNILLTSLEVTALYVIFTTAVSYIVRAISSNGKNAVMLNVATSIICIIAPIIMGQQEWDDHDRSKKTLAPDMAKDYLESCAPNAILFTFGDNDTYPLWYAQEVEGVRPDIRIINNSLLGIDWYINQLRYKINSADSVDVIWTPEQIEGHNREQIYYNPQGNENKDAYYNLYNFLKNDLGKRVEDPDTHRDTGPETFAAKRFYVPVDTTLVKQNGTVNPDDSVLTNMMFELPQKASVLLRNDLMILNIIASNKWKRPIYFSSPFGELGFEQYLRKDGLTYRLVPIVTKSPQSNWEIEKVLQQARYGSSPVRDNNSDFIYKNLMDKFEFGGADKKGNYFDEENMRHLLAIREIFGEAAGILADKGKPEEAQKLLDKCEKGIRTDNMPYAMVSRYNSYNQVSLVYLEGCYKTADAYNKAGKKDLAEKVKQLAEKVRQAIRKDLEQQKKYYEYIRDQKPEFFGEYQNSEYPVNEIMLDALDAIEKRYAPEVQPKKDNVNNPANNTLLQKIVDSLKKTDTTKKDTSKKK